VNRDIQVQSLITVNGWGGFPTVILNSGPSADDCIGSAMDAVADGAAVLALAMVVVTGMAAIANPSLERAMENPLTVEAAGVFSR
jgi:hypothetical protein